jgi:type VI secretion system secreted protein VgrG
MYGRIKVQFFWDQDGTLDENSSCWIRVAQPWAGKQWGGMFTPRIGQEVIVSFLDGNPDRPVVVGSLYNASQTVPYTLPDSQTRSTIKTNSSKGGGGFNEIRFEDKAGSEELFLQAQKDMNVTVLNDYTSTVTKDFSLKVSGNLTIEASGTVSIKSGSTFINEAGSTLTNKAATTLTNQAGSDLTNKAGTSLTNDAATALTNKAGTTLTSQASASQTVDGGGQLSLKGGMVKVN